MTHTVEPAGVSEDAPPSGWFRVEYADLVPGLSSPSSTHHLVCKGEDWSALRQQLAEMRGLVEELRNDFINIIVGGCTCGTKPPDPALHELNCHYRMAEAGMARIAKCAALAPTSQPAETQRLAAEALQRQFTGDIAAAGADFIANCPLGASQPSRGKCEQFCNCKEPAVYWEKEGAICGQCGLLLAGTSKPDCAQPEHGQTCISAGCTRQALPNALLCQEHGEALPPALRGEDCAQPETLSQRMAARGIKARVKPQFDDDEQPERQGAKHSDDLAVDRFAAAMKVKLAKKREQGRAGWDDPTECTIEALARMLIQHAIRGDPLDVGNFAMMLWNRGCEVELLREAKLWLDAPRVEPSPPPTDDIVAAGKRFILCKQLELAAQFLDRKDCHTMGECVRSAIAALGEKAIPLGTITDAVVHKMCHYLRDKDCAKCPVTVATPYGDGEPGCYGIAFETVQMARCFLYEAAQLPAPPVAGGK